MERATYSGAVGFRLKPRYYIFTNNAMKLQVSKAHPQISWIWGLGGVNHKIWNFVLITKFGHQLLVKPDAQLNILLCRDACQGVDFTNNCYLCDRKANQWVSAEEKFSFHQSKLADYAHDQPRWLPLQPYGRQVLEKESSSAFARVELYRGWLKQKLCSATTARKRYQICNLQSLRTFVGGP